LIFYEAELELQILPFNIAQLAKPIPKRLYQVLNLDWGKIAYTPNLRSLLRSRRERPSNRAAPKERAKISPSH